MTLPTYVNKARARRTVRTIELTGINSSGHDQADTALARDASESAEQSAQVPKIARWPTSTEKPSSPSAATSDATISGSYERTEPQPRHTTWMCSCSRVEWYVGARSLRCV